VIARLCGIALDARVATRTRDARELAHAARWIAANLVSVRGGRVIVDGDVPARGCVLDIQVTRFGDLLAVLAAVPVLVDADTLPVRWRMALRALGVPVLDRPAAAALAAGASVAALTTGAGSAVRVIVVEPDVRPLLAA